MSSLSSGSCSAPSSSKSSHELRTDTEHAEDDPSATSSRNAHTPTSQGEAVILSYQPPGADKRSWVFEPAKMMTSEAEAIEKITALTWDEFGLALVKGSLGARRALLWVLLKRSEPTLRHSQVDPPVGSIVLEYERHELVTMREEIEKADGLTDDERSSALTFIESEIETAPTGPDDAGKALGSDDDSPDSETSPRSLASARRKASG